MKKLRDIAKELRNLVKELAGPENVQAAFSIRDFDEWEERAKKFRKALPKV